jgi:hypothetical protein
VTLTRSGDDPRELLRALDAFASGRVEADVGNALALRAAKLVARGFDEAKAPSGERWRPLAASTTRGRLPRRPLRKTGALYRAATTIRFTTDGFMLTSTSIGSYHQSEAARSRLPRRPFFPDESGLSVGWAIELRDAADEALRRWVP